jgi:hypothetical protein
LRHHRGAFAAKELDPAKTDIKQIANAIFNFTPE